jgi:hypothetical protein
VSIIERGGRAGAGIESSAATPACSTSRRVCLIENELCVQDADGQAPRLPKPQMLTIAAAPAALRPGLRACQRASHRGCEGGLRTAATDWL